MTFETQPAQPLSGWRALLRVILEPGATFEQLGPRPPVLPGYLVQTGLVLVGTLLSLPALMAIAEQQALAQGQPAELMAMTRYVAVGSGVFSAVAGPWFSGLLLALACLFFGQFQRTEASFTGYFGLAGYARLPLAIGTIINGLMMRLSDVDLTQMQSMSISPAAFLPVGANPYLAALLGQFNPFTLWFYALLAIGFGTLHRKTARAGLVLVIALFVINTLLAFAGVGVASKFSTM